VNQLSFAKKLLALPGWADIEDADDRVGNIFKHVRVLLIESDSKERWIVVLDALVARWHLADVERVTTHQYDAVLPGVWGNFLWQRCNRKGHAELAFYKRCGWGSAISILL
jgi:hypothetical protein